MEIRKMALWEIYRMLSEKGITNLEENNIFCRNFILLMSLIYIHTYS
jgi:hypothetical protein